MFIKSDQRLIAEKTLFTDDHLWFTRYFFKQRMGVKFIVNWHHVLISNEIDRVISGETQNLIINVAPGSSKTEIVVINFMARGLAINPNARFLHLSYSDDLAMLNSQTARDIVRSEEFQRLWPMEISNDTKAKKRWNVMVDGKKAGGVYATSLSGQVTGFRAGHMAEGFQGAIVIDDPLKPEDIYSKTKVESANRRLISTVKSRKANPKTPIVIIMQRLGENDPTGFVEKGGLQGNFKIVKIPAMLTEETMKKHIPETYWDEAFNTAHSASGEFSYWEYKEPVHELIEMSQGTSSDENGNIISRHVFNAQMQQEPRAVGGNLIKGSHFHRFEILPKILYRKIFADTAQKTAERNDFSVFECYGMGDDGRIYLLDMIRGKWESPELKRRARAFWIKHHSVDHEKGLGLGQLREMKVEDKSSGTDLIQTLRVEPPIIPIKPIQRNTDKVTRVHDALPYIEAGLVAIPSFSPFVSDFLTECEGFRSDMTHTHDDQIDPMLDAIEDMLSTQNRIKTWEKLGGNE